jgi:hypothetical protein
VSRLRHLLLTYRAAAALVVALALVVRVLVPAGFMPMVDRGGISIVLCTGTGPQTVSMAMPGMDHGAEHGPAKHDGGKPEAPCAFAGLSAPALGGADPALLLGALLFILLAGWAPVRRPAVAAPRLRPPLRGPPLPA